MDILFVCDGNVARSQEAELFFKALAGSHHHAASAGTNPKVGKPIDPAVVHVMSEVGYGMEGCYRKGIDLAIAKRADLIVSFKSPKELPDDLARLNTVRYWSVPDPKGKTLTFHREVRDKIQSMVAELVSDLSVQ